MAGRSVTSISEQKASVPAKSAESPNLFNAEFKAFVNDILSQWNNPGVSLAIIDGENVYAEVWSIAQAIIPLTLPTNLLGVRPCNLARHQGNVGDAVLYRVHDKGVHCGSFSSSNKQQGISRAGQGLEHANLLYSTRRLCLAG